METRATKFIIILGTNGTGKSTFVKKMTVPYINKAKNRVLICTPHPEEWLEVEKLNYHVDMTDYEKYHAFRSFNDIRRVVVNLSRATEDIESIITNFRDGMLILDDCRAFLKAFTSDAMEVLHISRRQRMLDVVAVAHSFKQMPPVFFEFFTSMVLFKIRQHPNARKDELSEDMHELLPIYEKVQRESVVNPHFHAIYERK